MYINRLKTFYFLLLLLLIAPFGVGIPLNFGFKTLDLPKIFTFIILIILLYNLKGYTINRTTKLVGLFIFLHFLSTLYSYDFAVSLTQQIGFILLYYSGYFAMDYFVRNKTTLTKVVNILKMGFIILASYSVIEFILGYNPLDSIRTAYLLNNASRFNTGIGRLFRASMGNYASNLPFAYLLSALFFLYIAPSFNSESKNKWYTIFSFAVGIPALFFTQSRAMYIAFSFTLLLSFLLRSKIGFMKRLMLLISFPLIIIVLYYSIGGTIKRFLITYVVNIEVQKRGDQGLGGRFQNNVIDFNYAMQSPIFGHGSGSLYHNKSGKYMALESSDSSYLITILADRGIISLALFLLILGIILFRLYRIGKRRADLAQYSEAIFFAILVFTMCLNSSQREESLFFYFALFGIGNRIYEMYKLGKQNEEGLSHYSHI